MNFPRPAWRETLGCAVLTAVYVAAGRFGLSLDAVSGFAAPVWPPAGIALAALMLRGAGLWPAVMLGALIVNRMAGAPWPLAALIAAGNTLEVLAALSFLRQAGERRLYLDRPQEVLALVWKAALLSTAVSATIGVAGLLASGLVSAAKAPAAWSVWWVGDALGDLIVAPVLLVWSVPFRPQFRRWKEAAALGLSVAGCVAYIFGAPRSASFIAVSATLVYPPLVWAALRFGPRGATAAVAAVSAAAVWGTAHGGGPFAAPSLNQSLLSLQLFMAVVSVSVLLLAAEVASRRRVEEVLYGAREDLERRVAERTAELARSNGSLQDEVAQRRLAEEEVRRLNRALEERVLDRTRALEASNVKIRASLAEKETLLKEIHHRVKNNLQVVYSLISLQARHLTDPKTLEGLQDCRERVRAMAMVHEKLYKSKDLGKIDFGEYIPDLTNGLVQTYGARGVKVRVEAEDVRLGIDEAVPCGLMVHELVSNCLKHAFPGGRTGEVAVELGREASGRLRLQVRDDGVGFPRGLDFRTSSSLGLQLVCGLTRQLGGEIDLNEGKDGKGAAFTVTFHAQDPVHLDVPG